MPGTPSIDEEFVVAPAKAGEREAIVALWERAGLTVPYNNPRTDFDFAAGKPNSDVLAGTIDGRIAASVMVGHDGHRGWLYYVAVDPDFRGLGLGARIVAAGETWLRKRGIAKINLLIRDTNTVAEGFYKRLGYEAVPRIVMQKWLISPQD